MNRISSKSCFLRIYSSDPQSEKGGVLPLLAVSILVLIQIVSFVVDFGFGWNTERQLQLAADSASLAGVEIFLQNPASKTSLANAQLSVIPEAQILAAANGVTQAEITYGGGITPGQYDDSNGTFSPLATPFDALEVKAKRSFPTFIAHMLGVNSLAPQVTSIAYAGSADNVDCLLPFALDDDVLAGINYGDTITIGNNSPGNWGKIDIGGNMSSNPVFVDAMTNGACSTPVSVGDQFDPGTGFAGVQNGFDGRIAVDPVATLPVVSHFPNGNHPLTIVGFVVVRLEAQNGQGGINWNGQITLLNESVGGGVSPNPANPPFAPGRVLVK